MISIQISFYSLQVGIWHWSIMSWMYQCTNIQYQCIINHSEIGVTFPTLNQILHQRPWHVSPGPPNWRQPWRGPWRRRTAGRACRIRRCGLGLKKRKKGDLTIKHGDFTSNKLWFNDMTHQERWWFYGIWHDLINLPWGKHTEKCGKPMGKPLDKDL